MFERDWDNFDEAKWLEAINALRPYQLAPDPAPKPAPRLRRDRRHILRTMKRDTPDLREDTTAMADARRTSERRAALRERLGLPPAAAA